MMVRETLISKKHLYEDLAGNPLAKDELLCQTYGFTREDLSMLRQGTYFEKAFQAAVLLRDRGFSNQINSTILPALCFAEWDEPEKMGSKIGHSLANRYRHNRNTFRALGIHVPYIQLLREDVGGIYHGNLYDSKEHYEHFVPGRNDWGRSVRIPITIDGVVAELLGIYWGDGHLCYTQQSSSGLSSIFLTGNKNDFHLYRLVIAPRVNEVHGLEVPVESHACRYNEGTVGDRTFSANPDTPHPAMIIGSQAIASWLRDDLGFPPHKTNVQFPSLSDDWSEEILYAFFRGLLASMGDVKHLSKGHPGFIICESDDAFIENIANLARSLGYTPNMHHSDGNPIEIKIYFSSNELRRMMQENAIINPHHLGQLR